jgi:EpsI family protein
MSRSYLLLLVVGAILLVDGYVYGLWTARWHQTHELTAAVAHLDEIPMTVGDWQGTPSELDPKVVERAEFAGYVLRRYENRRGDVVSLLIACARPGPLSVHTPETCYGGAGFQMVTAEAARQSLDPGLGTPPAEMWKATFARDTAANPERLRVLWSWNSKGVWTAPNNPRWKFAGQPVLYKIYVTQAFLPQNEETDGAACLAFLREFLPEFNKILTTDH